MRFTHSSISALALAAATNMVAGSALAVCQATTTSSGAGLPSISATEASTAQALEIAERRKDEAVAGVVLASAEEAVAQDTTSAGSSSAGSGAAGGSAGPKKYKPVTQPQGSTYGAQQTASYGGTTQGMWGSGWGDYERNGDVNIGLRDAQPGNNPTLTRTKDDVTVTRTTGRGGFLAGYDWTYVNGSGTNGHQLGVFGGYDESHSDFSDGSFSTFTQANVAGAPPGSFSEEFFNRFDTTESTEAGNVGTYASFFHGKFTTDALFKAAFGNLDHDQSLFNLGGCGFAPTREHGDVDYAEYTIAANASYRYDLSRTSWFEPLLGIQFTYTDFGTPSGTVLIGSQDGQDLKLQGGGRLTDVRVYHDGSVLTVAYTGLLYSDVLLDGFVGDAFVSTGTLTTPTGKKQAASLNDEGKLRVLGDITAQLAFENGFSLVGEIDVRGGDEYFGVGGRVGGRYVW